MSRSVTTQLYTLVIVAAVIGFAIVRRMRPQPVRPNRLLVSSAIITVVLLVSLAGSGGRIIGDPVALALIPVFAAAGLALGYYLVRAMTFWTDPSTGALWMRGGVLFAVIVIGSILLRFAVRLLATGSAFGASSSSGAVAQHGLLYDLSADLIFLSLGVWLARAYLIYQRYQTQVAASG